jgi:hypothetical protein
MAQRDDGKCGSNERIVLLHERARRVVETSIRLLVLDEDRGQFALPTSWPIQLIVYFRTYSVMVKADRLAPRHRPVLRDPLRIVEIVVREEPLNGFSASII